MATSGAVDAATIMRPTAETSRPTARAVKGSICLNAFNAVSAPLISTNTWSPLLAVELFPRQVFRHRE
jgi:hypothetical protein